MTPKLEWRDAGLSMHDMTMRYAAEVPDLGLWLLVMRSRGAWSCDIGLRSGERWCAAEDCATHEEAQAAGESWLVNRLRALLCRIDGTRALKYCEQCASAERRAVAEKPQLEPTP